MNILTEKDLDIFFTELYKKLNNYSYRECLFNDGSCKKPIRSHTLQNAKVIEQISLNGHVGMFKLTFGQGISIEVNIPRSKATTFLGICNAHDTSIFKPIDLNKNEAFDYQDSHKLNLLAYRGLLKEYFEKLNNKEVFKILLDIIKTRDLKRLHNFIPYTKKFKVYFPFHELDTNVFSTTLEGIELALRDIQNIKTSLEESIFNGVDLVDHDVIIFEKNSLFALSSICTPNTFFDNSKTLNNLTLLQETNPKLAPKWSGICLNIFPDNNKVIIVFSTPKNESSLKRFALDIKEAKDQTEKEKLLTYFILYNIANVIFSPEAYKNISKEMQEKIKKIFASTIIKDTDYPTNKEINFFELF